MYIQITIKYQDHIILFEGGDHNLIIEHLKDVRLIALDTKINVKCDRYETEGVDFNATEEAIEFIEKMYYKFKYMEIALNEIRGDQK